MKTKSMWWKGFLQAEEHYKDGAFVENGCTGWISFLYPEGGSIEYCGNLETSYQFERGMRDYIEQYEDVIKEVIEL